MNFYYTKTARKTLPDSHLLLFYILDTHLTGMVLVGTL